MSVDLEALKRQIYDGTGGRPVLPSVTEWKYIARFWERAERVKLHAGRLVERIDEFESCVRDRGNPPPPCHGVPLAGMFDVRDVLRVVLAAEPSETQDALASARKENERLRRLLAAAEVWVPRHQVVLSREMRAALARKPDAAPGEEGKG